MSEDEACRRIEVARLGRRFATIWGPLASGALSLSVAAVLKGYLTEENQTRLLALVSGKSVRAAREELAAHFPMPDVPSSIRKLPQRAVANRGMTAPRRGVGNPARGGETPCPSQVSPRSTRDIAGVKEALAPLSALRGLAAAERSPTVGNGSAIETDGRETDGRGTDGRETDGRETATATDGRAIEGDSRSNGSNAAGSAAGRSAALAESSFWRNGRARIEPVSAGRYRVQFTASLGQKEKLELALDLMSHQNPSRDLATVVERGLEVLIEDLLRKRTGKTSKPMPTRKSAGGRVSCETRRVVAERDGLRCAFVSELGRRCEARAFLEFDHEQPLAKGGGSASDNVRLLCRAHNGYCAELAYGRAKIVREIARRNGHRPESEGG